MRLQGLLVTLPLLLTPAVSLAATPGFTPGEGNVTIDASVLHDVTPDIVILTASCEVTVPADRKTLRGRFLKHFENIRAAVGSDGKVRRSGAPSYYSIYMDPTLPQTAPQYTGNMSLRVTDIATGSFTKVAEKLEDEGCTLTWDVRITYSGKYAREQKVELLKQIEDKKMFFEDLIGSPLTAVTYSSLSTSLDYGGGYGGSSAYDPVTNTVPAITTLSVTFDIGGTKAAR